MKTQQKAWQGLSLIMLGRVIQALGQLATIRTLTFCLSPSEAGRSYLLWSLTSWFSLVLVSPITVYVERCLIEWNIEGKARDYFLRYFAAVFAISWPILVALVLIRSYVGVGIEVTAFFLTGFVVSNVFLSATSAAVTGGLNILGQRGLYVFFSNLEVWIRLILAAILASRFSATAEFWVGGQLAGQAVALALASATFLYALSPARAGGSLKTDWRLLTNFASSYSATVGASWVQTSGYRFVLRRVAGDGAVGKFAVGYAIGAGIMTAFDGVFQRFYQPVFYASIAGQDKSGRASAWNEYASCFLPAAALTGLFVVLAGGQLAEILVSHNYSGVSSVVILAAITESLRFVSSSCYMAGIGERDMGFLVVPALLAAVTSGLGVYVLGRWNPLIGTGIALCLGAFVMTTGSLANIRKRLPVRLPFRRVGEVLMLAAPMVAIFMTGHWLRTSGHFRSHGSLVVGGIYMCAAQVALGRKWLFGPSRGV